MKKLSLKSLLVILGLSSLLMSCIEDNGFKPIKSGSFTLVSHELKGITVNELLIKGDWIFAATTNGVYGKKLNAPSQKFIQLGLQNNDIRDLHLFTTSEILASVVNFTPGDTERKVYRTTNGGKNWSPFETNFGGPDEKFTDGLSDFEAVPGQPDHIYGAGQIVVAKSLDRGKTWTTIWGNWGMAAQPTMNMAVNPLKPDEIWAGGQGSIENGYLVRIKNGEEVNAWYDLVPNPTVVNEIVFDRANTQTIYVGWEGELSKTTDNGKTWQTLINRHQEAHFFFGIGLSLNISSTVYSAKWIKANDDQKLEIYYSEDKGATWKTEEFPQISPGGVWDLKVTQSGNKDRIFMGLHKGGIVELVNNKVGSIP